MADLGAFNGPKALLFFLKERHIRYTGIDLPCVFRLTVSVLEAHIHGIPSHIWVFKGPILNTSDPGNDTYDKCYSLHTLSGALSGADCLSKQKTICEVPLRETCNDDFQQYFNGYCYRVCDPTQCMF